MWDIRKIIDSMVIIPRDNRDEDQDNQSMVGSFPQRMVTAIRVGDSPQWQWCLFGTDHMTRMDVKGG